MTGSWGGVRSAAAILDGPADDNTQKWRARVNSVFNRNPYTIAYYTTRNPPSTTKALLLSSLSLLVYCAKVSEPVCSSMLVVIGYLVTETAFRKGRKSFLISGLLLVAILAVFLFLFF